MNNDNIQKTSLMSAAGVKYLDGTNMKVYENNGFPAAKITLCTEDGKSEETDWKRIWLHRSFPLDFPEEYISVQNKDGEEIGLIRRLSDLDTEAVEIIRAELSRKYYMPKIQKITSLKEIRGFSYWKTETDAGNIEFTLQDTYRSLQKRGDVLFVSDICGNRYVIESYTALDTHSRKKLEIYL